MLSTLRAGVRRINAVLKQAGAIEYCLVEDDEYRASRHRVRLLKLPSRSS